MKEALEYYFNIINDYWNQKGIKTILESNEDIINILSLYIEKEQLHIDMQHSGWTENKKFIILLNDIKNNQVGYISITQNECNVTYKNLSSFDKFTLNENIDGYFSDSFNIKGNTIENITEFNKDGIYLSNGVIPYLSHNLASRFSEALSLHKMENERLGQKRLVKTYN